MKDENFVIKIETLHCGDRGNQENVSVFFFFLYSPLRILASYDAKIRPP